MAERWKRIPGHPGYEASSLGRVRSVDRTLSDGREAGGMVLALTEDKDGYLRVKLGRRLVGVHTLVALAFHGPPEVRHVNDDPKDNRPEGLVWGSRKENERDKRKNKSKKEKAVVSSPLGIATTSVTPVTNAY
jgi:hypothetical protein